MAGRLEVLPEHVPGQQVGCVAGRDLKLAGKDIKKEKRELTYKSQKVKTASHKRKFEEVVTGEEFVDGPSTDQTVPGHSNDSKDTDMIVNLKKKRSKVQLDIDATMTLSL